MKSEYSKFPELIRLDHMRLLFYSPRKKKKHQLNSSDFRWFNTVFDYRTHFRGHWSSVGLHLENTDVQDLGFPFGGGEEDGAGKGNGSPLQYSCLETLMDKGAWRAAVRGVTQS